MLRVGTCDDFHDHRLTSHGATKSERKRALQLRLRALIIAEAIEDAVDDA